MTPLFAFVFGFTFSFAWTPCIGPALASVLMLASSSESVLQGNLLVLVYTIGFAVPFLFVGFFTTELLNFLKKHQKILKYTIKISAIILILIGILTLTGTYEKINAYLNQWSNNTQQEAESTQEPEKEQEQDNSSSTTEKEPEEQQNTETNDANEQSNNSLAAIDFTLQDQYGKQHHLADYKGKVVFLNFWTTWCVYCKAELQDLQELYNEYGKNEKDVVFLGVTSPSSNENKNAADVSKEEIMQYIEQNSLDFPMLFDEKGDVYQSYYIYSFPTSFLINQKGEVEWYSPGALPKERIKSEIDLLLGEDS